ncbi:MAG: TetR/AcrR family transcriptional regulator [Propionibacteriaceae bacterium]|nr:TetR/AcrR family transcriptional regulator [Propionibacteriaceae bacterium]
MARSRPRPVEERRRDIIAATVPLLAEEGFLISTRRIADAAGVAEGTLFRAFPTKGELLREAAASYLNPADLIAEIDAIDPTLPLADKVRRVMDTVEEAASRFQTLMATVKGRGPRAAGERPPWPPSPGAFLDRPHPDSPIARTFHDRVLRHVAGQAAQLREAIERLLAPNAPELAVDVRTAATHVLTVGVASLIMRPAFPDTNPDFVRTLAVRAIVNRKETE